MSIQSLCPFCLGEIELPRQQCPFCGKDLENHNPTGALALGTLRILRGEEPVHTFHPVCPLPAR